MGSTDGPRGNAASESAFETCKLSDVMANNEKAATPGASSQHSQVKLLLQMADIVRTGC